MDAEKARKLSDDRISSYVKRILKGIKVEAESGRNEFIQFYFTTSKIEKAEIGIKEELEDLGYEVRIVEYGLTKTICKRMYITW